MDLTKFLQLDPCPLGLSDMSTGAHMGHGQISFHKGYLEAHGTYNGAYDHIYNCGNLHQAS